MNEMNIPYADEDLEGVRQVALGYLKQKDDRIKELEDEIKRIKVK